MWTRLDRQIRLESDTGHLLRSCKTSCDFFTLLSVERRSISGNVCWISRKWRQRSLLCNRSWRLSSKLVAKGCQNRNGPCVPKPTSREEEDAHEATRFSSEPWSTQICQMEKRRQARHRNCLPQDRERDDSLVQMPPTSKSEGGHKRRGDG